jgi:tripartite-type tricarboxylate transporter receptor subunit TctC
MQSVLSSEPDGYTIGFVAPNNAINASLYKKLPFDFLRDSAPVAGTMFLTNVMVVNPSVPANNVKEFIAYAKANPGKSTWHPPALAPRCICRVNSSWQWPV